MGDADEYFPRGGKKPSVTYFKQSGNFLGAVEKGERKKVKPKKKSEEDDGYLSEELVAADDQSVKNCGVYLNYKIVKEGQVLLGRVRQVLDTKIHVSLPCRLVGTVMACHISESYNKLLDAYVNDKTDKVQELLEMFRPGQYVAVKVLEVRSSNLLLSMMPQHVNAGRLQSDLHRGALLQGAVSSEEDHGYVMEMGINNTRAFLPKTAVNPELKLDTGVLTWCCVKSVVIENDSSVLTLSNELEALQKAVQRKPTSTLLPATALEFTVDRSLENGIEGHVLDDTTAYVQRQQVDKVKGKRPNLGQRIRARVLYVIPTRNTPFLTMKDIFATTYPNLEAEQKFSEGEIIEDAQVIKIMGRSIIFKMGKGSIGTMSLRRIQVDENLADEDVVAKSYPIGSTHTVRVLCYNLSDYTYSLSDEPSILEETIFTMKDLAVGDIVQATVKTVAEDRLTLAVGRVTGYVPHTHMWDSGVYVDPKKASNTQLSKKKFKEGQPVRARVLNLDPVKPALMMTLKSSLMAPDLEVLQSYEQAEVGKSYTGVIMYIRNYLVVSFFNNVLCHVARHHVARPPPPDLSTLFHLGQIVNCTIIKVKAEDKKMSGSLLADALDWKKKKNATKRQLPEESTVPKKKKVGTDPETAPHELNSKERKKKKVKNSEAEKMDNVVKKDNETDVENKTNENINEIDTNIEKKKRKKKKETIDITDMDNNAVEKELFGQEESVTETEQSIESVEKVKKRKKKNEVDKDTENSKQISNGETDNDTSKKIGKRKNKTNDSQTNTDDSEVKRKGKKKKKEAEPNVEENKAADESDAIETDYHEDSDDVLTPQDRGLLDLSDCTTLKHYKKRIESIIKSIDAKCLRINRIESKINLLESRTLTPSNKKFHTAMHLEKHAIELRMQKLIEGLKVVQEKFKELSQGETKEGKKKKEKTPKVVEIKKKTENKEVKPKAEEKSKKRKIESLETVIDIPSAKEFWSAAPETQQSTEQQTSSSSDEEEEEKPKKKRKKLTAAEKVAKVREEEERIRQIEKLAVDAAAAPRSAEHFERALLANPNSSQLWIAYMAFHLQATEIDKARAVGRRALTTISFREEQEKLNVWLAMLNFEHRFGTKESQQSTLDEALQTNDKYQVHCKLLEVYVETGKAQELMALVEQMLRKYRRQVDMYVACGSACYTLGLLDKARHVMQKGIQALEKKEHVSLLVRFAQLERSHGSAERAEALFEQVLAVYPQRVDVCAVYVDALVKTGDHDRVRQVMERMTSQKLPARKMKVLYKKWIEIEERLGDKQQIDIVRQRAKDYIEKAVF
ncbi:rRNA biogenesis protein RRP5 [Battus philenor]|uniref:rRNA biogenesis protein RRP5 n=1 Tax=Battus philenor TaxID=42288 RepID=UPI0035CF51E8